MDHTPLPVHDADGSDEEEDMTPSAPPWEHDLPPGYEVAMTGNDADLPPPPYESLYPSKSLNRQMSTANEGITEEEAKTILLNYVNHTCCYGSRAARDLLVTNIENTCAYHYVLETHAEGRKATWKYEPYRGEPIPTYNVIPAPWDVPVNPPPPFVEQKKEIVVPETRVVRICHKCKGKGKHRCSNCHGRGKTHCSFCSGHGHRGIHATSSGSCPHCNGQGRKRCISCSGSGKRTCSACHGQKYLLHFILIVVQWKYYKKQLVFENSEISEKSIKKVTGDTAFTEENTVVPALNDFWIPEVNVGSATLINELVVDVNRNLQRIIRQRHSVHIIPIAEVQYLWKDKQRKFFVFGSEKKVFAPQYPQNCCCCCSLS